MSKEASTSTSISVEGVPLQPINRESTGKSHASITKDPDGDLEVEKSLVVFEAGHQWDPNLPAGFVNEVHQATLNHDFKTELAVQDALIEDSPYPEVQAAVRNYDEDIPANTVRAWTIGLFLVTLCGGMNMLFHLRSPAISISAIVAQFLAYPLGRLWELCLPKKTFNTLGYRWSFNPGPFNMKEHTVITVMANASFGIGAAYSTDVLTSQQKFYGVSFGWGYGLLLTWTTTMIGYGMAGLGRRFLV
jgi:hypothetical protein